MLNMDYEVKNTSNWMCFFWYSWINMIKNALKYYT